MKINQLETVEVLTKIKNIFDENNPAVSSICIAVGLWLSFMLDQELPCGEPTLSEMIKKFIRLHFFPDDKEWEEFLDKWIETLDES